MCIRDRPGTKDALETAWMRLDLLLRPIREKGMVSVSYTHLEGIYYTADVMAKGAYPYFAPKIWKKYGVNLDITPEDVVDLQQGTVCLLYTSRCV